MRQLRFGLNVKSVWMCVCFTLTMTGTDKSPTAVIRLKFQWINVSSLPHYSNLVQTAVKCFSSALRLSHVQQGTLCCQQRSCDRFIKTNRLPIGQSLIQSENKMSWFPFLQTSNTQGNDGHGQVLRTCGRRFQQSALWKDFLSPVAYFQSLFRLNLK